MFLPQGDGWIQPVAGDAPQTEHLPPWTLSEADRERRIRIARLTARQARKYRTTLKLIELADSDLRTASVAARLGITRATLRRCRKEAPDTIAKVETQVDAWTEALASPKAIRPLNTLAPGARPASASIVAPYHETVRRLAAEGEGHPRIPDVIVRESQGRFFGQRQHGIPVLAQTAARKRPSWEQPIRKSGLRSDEEALIRAPPLRSPA